MDKTMINVRRPLKPGGRLTMLEFVRDQMWSSLIFGALPGWWMGYEEGRKLSPALSTDAWDKCLKNTGFSGTDAVVPYQSNIPISLAVISSQAVDNRINFLRSPLTPGTLEITSPNLLVIGGNTTRVSDLAKRCVEHLSSFYQNIKMVNSFEDLASVEVPFMGTVINLSDLDEPMFKKMTTAKIDGAKKLFEQSKTCLWITEGTKHVDPFQNMSLGFGRTVTVETPHLRLQFLGFSIPVEVAADIIAEKILQLEVYDTWEQLGHQNMLWSVEPEITYEKGSYLIPRIVPDPIRNARYNSVRRFITKDVDPQTSSLNLQWSGNELEVRETPKDSIEPLAGPRDSVRVDYSTLRAVKVTSTDYLYLVLGKNTSANELVFALTPHRQSLVKAPSSWTVPYHASLEEALSFMPIISSHLAALAVVGEYSTGETLVFLEPDHDFAEVFSAIASQKGINVVNLTTEPCTKRHGWVSIHPNAPRRLIQSVLPKNVSCFIDNLDYGILGSIISTCFPRGTEVKDGNFLSQKEAKFDEVSCLAFIPSALRSAWVRAHQKVFNVAEPSVIAVNQISPESQPTRNTALVQWSGTSTVPVKVGVVDAQKMFSPAKTYWLIGLTGGLGLSLCCCEYHCSILNFTT
jgi:hybrid polyketide synthase/nonribosomal peptide synthetase ACE1